MIRDPSANGPSIAVVPASSLPAHSDDQCKRRQQSLKFDRRTPMADILLAESTIANASNPLEAAELLDNLTRTDSIRSNRSTAAVPASHARYTASLAESAIAALRQGGLPDGANRTERCGHPARTEAQRMVFFRDDPGVATDRTNRLMVYHGYERTAWAGGAGWDSTLGGWFRRYYGKFGTPRFVSESSIATIDVPSGTSE